MRWPSSEVGASWPPVIPYVPLLTKIAVMRLAASRRVDDLGRADGREVAIALVREDEGVGPDPAHAGRDRGRPAVGRFDEVDREVVVGEHAAADRRDADRPWGEVQLVEQLGHQSVDDPVAAARAVVGGRVDEATGRS